MANFYSATGNSGNNTNFGGNFGTTGYGSEGATNNDNQGGSGFQQFQQQPQQNTGFSNNAQQWQAQPQGQPYGQRSQQPSQQQQQQQQQTAQPFWSPNNVQQAATQAAAGFMAQAATGNLTGEKVLTQGMDQIQHAFGGGIPGMNYVMRLLRSYFAVDNRYVKRKMMKLLFPFMNKQWRRDVSNYYHVVYFLDPTTSIPSGSDTMESLDEGRILRGTYSQQLYIYIRPFLFTDKHCLCANAFAFLL